MPLKIPGSTILGPSPSGGAASLAAQLVAFGVTWYGGFRAGLGMYAVSTDQLTPVTTFGAPVGQWVPQWTAGGFTAKFIQSTNSKRPSYMAVYGTSGIQGDGTTTWLQLDSTTALNRDHTVLISATSLYDGGALYSQGINNMRVSIPGSASAQFAVYTSSSTGMLVDSVVANDNLNSTQAAYKIGWKSSGSAFYNNAPNLLRLSNSLLYTEACISEVWLIGASLTPAQIVACLPFLAL